MMCKSTTLPLIINKKSIFKYSLIFLLSYLKLIMNMENLEDLYLANMLSQTQESHSHAHEVGPVAAAAAAAYFDWRVPSDRTQEALASRNVALERNRREKLNQKLCQLRAAVPTISKMNKASTIKDAIEYIQSLLEQERIIQAEISELENGKPSNGQNFDFDHDAPTFCHRPNSPDQYCPNSATIISSPVEVRELRVLNMGDKTVVVTLECNKGTDTIIKLCEVFASLKLKITTANITAFPGRLLKTVFMEVDDEEKQVVRAKIEAAIAALNYPHSPMSTSKYQDSF